MEVQYLRILIIPTPSFLLMLYSPSSKTFLLRHVLKIIYPKFGKWLLLSCLSLVDFHWALPGNVTWISQCCETSGSLSVVDHYSELNLQKLENEWCSYNLKSKKIWTCISWSYGDGTQWCSVLMLLPSSCWGHSFTLVVVRFGKCSTSWREASRSASCCPEAGTLAEPWLGHATILLGWVLSGKDLESME